MKSPVIRRLATCALFIATSASAQRPVLETGDSVRIFAPSIAPYRLSGRVIDATRDSIILRMPDRRVIAESDVLELEVYRGRTKAVRTLARSGVIYGVLAGSLLGASDYCTYVGSQDGCGQPMAQSMALGALGWGVTGGIAGAITGMLRRDDVWEHVKVGGGCRSTLADDVVAKRYAPTYHFAPGEPTLPVLPAGDTTRPGIRYRVRCMSERDIAALHDALWRDAQAARRFQLDAYAPLFDYRSGHGFVVVEYYAFYTSDTGLSGHPYDLEKVFVFVPSDTADAARFRVIAGAGHSPMTPNNILVLTGDVARGEQQPHIIVERGGHSSSPDLPPYGAFQKGWDVNWFLGRDIWGTRDIQSVSGRGFLGDYQDWQTIPRDSRYAVTLAPSDYTLVAEAAANTGTPAKSVITGHDADAVAPPVAIFKTHLYQNEKGMYPELYVAPYFLPSVAFVVPMPSPAGMYIPGTMTARFSAVGVGSADSLVKVVGVTYDASVYSMFSWYMSSEYATDRNRLEGRTNAHNLAFASGITMHPFYPSARSGLVWRLSRVRLRAGLRAEWFDGGLDFSRARPDFAISLMLPQGPWY